MFSFLSLFLSSIGFLSNDHFDYVFDLMFLVTLLPWQEKTLAADVCNHDNTVIIRTSLGRFQKEIDIVKTSLLMHGASQHLVAMRTTVAQCFSGLTAAQCSDPNLENHCEQLRLRAASLAKDAPGRSIWPAVASFTHHFHRAGQTTTHELNLLWCTANCELEHQWLVR